MFEMFSRKRKVGPIGVDIGSSGVRMLQLGHPDGHPAVVAAAQYSFAEHGLNASDPVRRRRLAIDAVGGMLKSGRFIGRQAVSCLRTDELAIKNIRLPRMGESELASAVLWEARERFDFEVVKDRLHCIRAGEVRQDAETCDEIILIAASEETISQHLEMLAEMNLDPIHIDAEPAALFRTYHRFLRRAEDDNAVSVIVDMGLGSTKVVVARGRAIVLIKPIDIGGGKFNEDVARGLGLDVSEAISLRRGLAGTSRGESASKAPSQVEWSIRDAIRGQVEALAGEISLCLRYCSVTFRGLRPSEVLLTGGEAHDPAVVKLLSESLECKCVVGEPLGGVEISGVDLGEDRRSVLTEWSVATGLALRDLTLSNVRKTGDDRNRISA